MPKVLRSLEVTEVRSFHDTLIFQKNLAPLNQSGGFGEQWQTVCKVRANHEPRTRPGSEASPADWTTSVNIYLTLMYWRSDITEQMRILLGPGGGDVTVPKPVGYRVFLISAAPQSSKQDRFMEVYSQEVK